MDLHPIFDWSTSTIEFRLLRRDRVVRVDVPRETVDECFGVPDSQYGLLEVYEAHRDEIDAAVIRRAAEGDLDAVVIRPADVH